jgi:hypothetical protein
LCWAFFGVLVVLVVVLLGLTCVLTTGFDCVFFAWPLFVDSVDCWFCLAFQI